MGTENETNKNTEGKQISYSDFKYEMMEFSVWVDANRALLEQTAETKYADLYFRRESTIFKTEEIKDAANYVDNPGEMLKRVHEIVPALAFLDNEAFCNSFKQSRPQIYERLKKAREETAAIRPLIGQWIELYKNNYQYLLKDPDGSFFDLNEAAPNSPQAKAIQQRHTLEEKLRDYSLKKDAGINQDREKVVLTENPKNTNVHTDKNINPNNEEVVLTENANDANISADKNIKQDIEEVVLAEGAKDANTRIDKYNESTRGERDSFRQFADELKAVSRHDSKEYTNLINTLNECSKEFPHYKEDDKDAKVFNSLTDNQLSALTLVKVKMKIETYLNHKAKDGINRNAYDKLAAVEKLNRTISRKLKNLNVEKFSVPITDSKGKVSTFEFDPKNYHETYEEELIAAKNKNVINTDSSQFADDIARGYNQAHKSSFVDAEKLRNASSCIDRIMLRAQTSKENASLMKKIFKNGSPELREEAVKEVVLNSFLKVKNKLFDDPVTTKKAPVKNNPQGPNI